jgi:hypothetical protein
MKCDSRAFLLARKLASPCLGHKPKARVATRIITFSKVKDELVQIRISLPFSCCVVSLVLMLFPLCWCSNWCYFLCVYVGLFALLLFFFLLGFVTLPTCYCCFLCTSIVILFSLVLFFSRWCYNFFQANVMVFFMLVHLMLVLYVVLHWCCYFFHIQDITLLVGLNYLMAQPNSYC